MTERIDPGVVVALAVAVLGVVPSAWFLSTQPTATAEVQPVETVVQLAEPVVETVAETVTTQPIVVDGLDPSIAGVLQEQGFLGRTDSTDPAASGLDPAVMAVLIDHDVVLRVAEESEAP